MNKAILAAGLAMAVATPAVAATVTNLDDTAYTLVVTEGGAQLDVPVGAGETVEICPSGCFVTLPDGDRAVLTGPERVEIKAGRGRIF